MRVYAAGKRARQLGLDGRAVLRHLHIKRHRRRLERLRGAIHARNVELDDRLALAVVQGRVERDLFAAHFVLGDIELGRIEFYVEIAAALRLAGSCDGQLGNQEFFRCQFYVDVAFGAGYEIADAGGHAFRAEIQPFERVMLLLRIDRDGGLERGFEAQLRFVALRRKREIDFGRHPARNAAGAEIQFGQRVLRARRVVDISNGRILERHVINIDLDRRPLAFRRRRRGLVAARQIVDAELAVLAAHQVGAQIFDLDGVDHQLFRQQRHQLQRYAKILDPGKLLLAAKLRQRRFAEDRAYAREQRQLDVAIQLERALGLFLHRLHNLRLVLIGIESRRDIRAGRDQQDNDTRQR